MSVNKVLGPDDPCPQCGKPMVPNHNWPQGYSRCSFRDESDLTPQLIGFEGYRVEVTDVASECEHHPYHSDPDCGACISAADANKPRRFYVGKSTGWRPCHLEVLTRRSRGGSPAAKAYASVRRLYKR